MYQCHATMTVRNGPIENLNDDGIYPRRTIIPHLRRTTVTAAYCDRVCSFSIIDAARVVRVPLGGTYGADFAARSRHFFSVRTRVPGDGNISSNELRWSRSRPLFRLAKGAGGACTSSFLTYARSSASSSLSSLLYMQITAHSRRGSSLRSHIWPYFIISVDPNSVYTTESPSDSRA